MSNLAEEISATASIKDDYSEEAEIKDLSVAASIKDDYS